MTYQELLTLIQDSVALDVRSATEQGGTGIVFWFHPNSTEPAYRAGKITAHGTLVGSEKAEMAWYTPNSKGELKNRIKVFSGVDITPVFLPDASGITRPNGQPLKFGEATMLEDGTMGPTSPVIVSGSLNVLGALKVNGTVGASGTFVSKDNKTVTVTNGLITSII